MTNLQEMKTQVTIGASGKITLEKYDTGTSIRNMIKLHPVMLTNTFVYTGFHARLFRTT